MHKGLLILGLLHNHPLSGYDLHRIVRAHGELYTDLKKANLYYLLDRLAKDGYVKVRAEPGARGPRGERLVYSSTKKGRERFIELLYEILRNHLLCLIDAELQWIDRSLAHLRTVGWARKRRGNVRREATESHDTAENNQGATSRKIKIRKANSSK